MQRRRWMFLVVLWLGIASPALAARSWQPPLELSAPGAEAWTGLPVPSLSVTPEGRTTAAWTEHTSDRWTVKVLEKSPLTPAVGPLTLGGGVNPPSVATTSGGLGYVVWVGSTDAYSRGEQVLVSERAGGQWLPPRILATGAEGYGQPGTAVAADDHGDAVVLFTTASAGTRQLWSVRRTPDGVWHEPQAVSIPPNLGVWQLQAGMSESGEAVLAWESSVGTVNAWTLRAWTAIQPADGPTQDLQSTPISSDTYGGQSLAVDRLGNAIVTWLEPATGSRVLGEIHGAVRAPGHPFGPAIDIGGPSYTPALTQTRMSADGRALVAWQDARPNGPSGASLGGIRVAVGNVPAGTFTPPETVTSNLLSGPLQLAVDPAGNALFFVTDFHTREQMVIRRSRTGVVGQPRAVVPCTHDQPYAIAAGVDSLGNASLLWNQSSWLAPAWGLRLSQDTASSAFSPDPCPPSASPITWTPKDPAPGQAVTFDASGSRAPDAARVTFLWEFDGDSGATVSTGEQPTISHTFTAAGEHQVRLQVQTESRRTGWLPLTSATSISLRVGAPLQTPNNYPAGLPHQEVPPAQPDENPWPVAPIAPVAPPVSLPVAQAPVPQAPIPQVPPPTVYPPSLPTMPSEAIGLPRVGGLLFPEPSRAQSLPQSDSATLVIRTLNSTRRAALLTAGMPVWASLTTDKPTSVRLRLLDRHGQAMTQTVTLRVLSGQVLLQVLKLTRRGRGIARARSVHALTLEAAALGRPTIHQRVRLQ